MIKLMAFFGALFGAIGVIMGAFGAHALKEKISPAALNAYEVGVRYQLFHALALFATAWIYTQYPHLLVAFTGWLFIIGTLLFSGSLYLLAITGLRFFGPITPIGGALLVLGWLLLLIRLCLK